MNGAPRRKRLQALPSEHGLYFIRSPTLMSLPYTDDATDNLCTQLCRQVLRGSAHIPKALRTGTLIALQPLVTGLAADVKLFAGLCHCDEGLLNVLNELHSHLVTAFGFPWHNVIMPHSAQKCNLCDGTFL